MKLLLANGANFTQPDADGLTAVDKASKESTPCSSGDDSSDVYRCGYEGGVTTKWVIIIC